MRIHTGENHTNAADVMSDCTLGRKYIIVANVIRHFYCIVALFYTPKLIVKKNHSTVSSGVRISLKNHISKHICGFMRE